MKKYTKPTAKIIGLSVKESLSDLPAGLKVKSVVKTASYVNTLYSNKLSG